MSDGGIDIDITVPRSRADFSAATRQELVDRAQELFGSQGYAQTSLDEIVGEADVTKGALYHHFANKRDLFRAVFYQVEARWTARITAAINEHEDPSLRAAVGLRSFLEMSREEVYRRVIIQDGPSVLGQEIHDPERRTAFGTVTVLARRIVEPVWGDDGAMLRTFTRILYAAMTSAGATIASSSDPDAEIDRAEEAIQMLLFSMSHTVVTHPDLEETLNARSGPWVTRR